MNHAHPCVECGTPTNTFCSQCRCSWYCSRICQVIQWRGHRAHCQTRRYCEVQDEQGVWRQARRCSVPGGALGTEVQVLGASTTGFIQVESECIAPLHTHTSPWRCALQTGCHVDVRAAPGNVWVATQVQDVTYGGSLNVSVHLANGMQLDPFSADLAQHGTHTTRTHPDVYGQEPHVCPISQQCIQGVAAVTGIGHVYQARAIHGWFATGKRTDPITNIVLPCTKLAYVNAADSTAVEKAIQCRRRSWVRRRSSENDDTERAWSTEIMDRAYLVLARNWNLLNIIRGYGGLAYSS